MNFLTDIKKEIKSGIREYKFLIIILIFLFISIMTPVMTKIVLPEIFKTQFPDMNEEAIGNIIDMTQRGSLRTFVGDMFEIILLIFILVLCGITAGEFKENTFIFPVCSGKKYTNIIFSKFFVFSVFSIFITTISLVINYYFSGVLLSFELLSIKPIIRAGFLTGLYMSFIISVLILFGITIKKSIPTGIITLVLAYIIHFIGEIFNIHKYLPSGLFKEASQFAVVPIETLPITICITICIILSLLGMSIIELNNIEIYKR